MVWSYQIRYTSVVCTLCLLDVVEGVRRFRKKGDASPQDTNKVLYIFLAVFLACTCMCCLYICNRICPDGPIFGALELDDIRIGRVQEAENALQQQIESLQTRLTVQRMKRTNLLTQRDIAATVEDRLDRFNAKGQQIYGDAWDGKDGGTVPIKELVTIPDEEMRQMRIEAQNIVTARKADEERDLWKMWNQFKEDPGPSKKDSEGMSVQAGRSSGVSSATGQPDVLTGRAHRATKSSTSSDPRFGSSAAQPAAAVPAIPPPRSYVTPPLPQQVAEVPNRGIRPPPPTSGPSKGSVPPRGPIAKAARADDDYDNKIHSNFHSPPPRSSSDRIPLLSQQQQAEGSFRPAPPTGPPPGWRGEKPPAKLAPLKGAISSSSVSPLSPPLAPQGVLPPRGTPPPTALNNGRGV